MTGPALKICGIGERAGLDAAVAAGATHIGLVFFAKSPRCVDLDTATSLARALPADVTAVALVVDADDTLIDEITARVPVAILQLHGRETPDRVAEIRRRSGMAVMKAIGVAEAADLDQAREYARVADWLLFDAKPPKGAPLPGGNALSFDWRLLSREDLDTIIEGTPWMLAGGLTPATVADAIRLTGARAVDVSSGVESAPGVKDPERIKAFAAAAFDAWATAGQPSFAEHRQAKDR